ncbi:MAG: phospholipid/cholesterol/gamma-HCH transport system substrate-binding protein [Solirubrobacteraceae bacterium]|jgi:virulence factor Mce-like protein|nr:phospholipid/cholesterol/gamma-HCH transport system substrate-binding protein [Solirubrobacteraceae bacterium]
MTPARRRRRRASVFSPVLVGAVTTAVVTVAVFLAYNANDGLPFVPTRQLGVDLANGANLVPGNEVRSGGFRVGVVQDMTPVTLPGGRVGARLTLKLDGKFGAVPADSRVTVRQKSALGLKYVDLQRGASRRMLADGATLSRGQTRIPVEIDEIFNMFDEPTRRASAENLVGFGDALNGRGADLNATIGRAPELLGRLTTVMANLADPRTDVQGFFRELDDAARVVAPVSRTNARLFTTMADTFGALSRDPGALEATIVKAPATLDAGTRSFRVQRPFLAHTAELSTDVSAAAGELRRALPDVNAALAAATPVQRRMIELNEPLQQALDALERLVRTPETNGSLRGLQTTVGSLNPQLRYLGPYVTVCNDWNLWWTMLAEHMSAPDDTGSSQRALLNASSGEPGSDHIGAAGANEFAHGAGAPPGGSKQHLHANFYGPAVTADGKANCAAGQTGYVFAGNPYRDASVKDDPYRRAVVDRFPTKRPFGPTYKRLDREGKGVGVGRAEVPAGQTFTDAPGGIGIDVPKGGRP